jgi:hypothetical protein
MKKGLNYSLLLLAVLWLIVQGILFYKNGIVTIGEPPKYIEQAGNLLTQGHPSTPNFWLYSTEIFLIAGSLKLKLGFGFVVAIQLLLNIVATWSIYRFVASNFLATTAGTCTALFILNYPLQEFNTFLQTESLYYSLTIILSTALLLTKSLMAKRFFIIILLLGLVCFTRPTGLLFIPPVFLYLFFRFFKGIRLSYKIISVICVTGGFLFFLNTAIGSGGELDFMLPFRDESIICGVPTLPHFQDIKTTENSNSLYGLLYYITHNFGQFCKLAVERSIAFFGLIRSYYGAGHNIYLAVFFYLIYCLDVFGGKFWVRKALSEFLYFVIVILFAWVTVILTCDDWHNRFFLGISPFLIIMAAPAINRIIPRRSKLS